MQRGEAHHHLPRRRLDGAEALPFLLALICRLGALREKTHRQSLGQPGGAPSHRSAPDVSGDRTGPFSGPRLPMHRGRRPGTRADSCRCGAAGASRTAGSAPAGRGGACRGARGGRRRGRPPRSGGGGGRPAPAARRAPSPPRSTAAAALAQPPPCWPCCLRRARGGLAIHPIEKRCSHAPKKCGSSADLSPALKACAGSRDCGGIHAEIPAVVCGRRIVGWMIVRRELCALRVPQQGCVFVLDSEWRRFVMFNIESDDGVRWQVTYR